MLRRPSSRFSFCTFPRCVCGSSGKSDTRIENSIDWIRALRRLHKGKTWRRKEAAKVGMHEQLMPIKISSTLGMTYNFLELILKKTI